MPVWRRLLAQRLAVDDDGLKQRRQSAKKPFMANIYWSCSVLTSRASIEPLLWENTFFTGVNSGVCVSMPQRELTPEALQAWQRVQVKVLTENIAAVGVAIAGILFG